MPRGALVLAWVVAVTLVSAAAFIAYDLARGPGVPQPTPVEHVPAPRQDANPWARWSITESLSAHHVLVIQVETRFLHEARAIAQQIVKQIPPDQRYAEILIYFHRPGRPDPLAPRRVQWTPTHGFVETIFEP